MHRQAEHFLRPRLAGLALLAAAAVAAPAAVGAGTSGGREQALRSRDHALESQSRSAVLELYALETKLAGAEARLESIEGEVAAVRRERRLVDAQLRVARRGVAVSQGRLAQRLRALYEQGDVDPLAVVLASGSLDEALSGLESLGQMARGDERVLASVRHARSQLGALRARLALRERRLAALASTARSTARALGAARAARLAYVASLRSQQQLTRAALDRIGAQARSAEAKSESLQARPIGGAPQAASTTATASTPTRGEAASDPAAAPAEVPAPVDAAELGGSRTITVSTTGYALSGRTATGLPVGWGVVAVDPAVIPLGTRLTIPGYGEAVAADVGGGVRGATIDLWFPTADEAQAWGRRTVTVTLH